MAYKGLVEDTVFQLLGGLRAGMGYCGAPDIKTLQENGRRSEEHTSELQSP